MADSLTKCDFSLSARGLPEHSYFEVEFDDGSIANEKYFSWSSVSTLARVKYFGGTKSVYLCNLPVKRIHMHHDGLQATLEAQGAQVYQAVRSDAVWSNKGDTVTRILGRCIGLVREGEVIEEKFLNGVEHIVVGYRL